MFAPFSHPVYVMVKPVGAKCNLRCKYCYYLEKDAMYPSLFFTEKQMSEELLETFIKQYIECQSQREVMFIWHGGEPLLRGLDFYKKAIHLQQQHARGHVIDNCIQTNATLLNEDWCKFFADNHWLVGVSIDGPEHLHNEYRKYVGGIGSFDKVMYGIELLNQYNIEWNVLATVNNITAQHPVECYDFLTNLGTQFLQFTPVVERMSADGMLASSDYYSDKLTSFSVSPAEWGHFMIQIFDRWASGDVGKVFVRTIEDLLANWCGVAPGTCALAESCGYNAAMEWNGDVFSCDHFTFPQHRIGNINENTLTELVFGEKQSSFRKRNPDCLPRQCKECKWLKICNGECPRNRFMANGDDFPTNYLCEGYRKFFAHVEPYMNLMKSYISEGRDLPETLKL
ncbi:MAG: anaerobic sulfatase-maturation protein [Prevotellaceae bacterium]|nr:anaerobic sulfatase-maturation protein [Prevotellaceae bacterium]